MVTPSPAEFLTSFIWQFPAGGAILPRMRTQTLLAALLVSVLPASLVRATTLPTGYSETTVASVNSPTAMEFAPDGRLFVLELGGGVRIVQNGVLLPTPFTTV